MRASEAPFQSYKSTQMLSFANLICSSVSEPKALKKACLRFAILSYSEKLWNIFEIVFRVKRLYKNHSHWKKYFERKNSQTPFVVYVLIYPLSTF